MGTGIWQRVARGDELAEEAGWRASWALLVSWRDAGIAAAAGIGIGGWVCYGCAGGVAGAWRIIWIYLALYEGWTAGIDFCSCGGFGCTCLYRGTFAFGGFADGWGRFAWRELCAGGRDCYWLQAAASWECAGGIWRFDSAEGWVAYARDGLEFFSICWAGA